MSEKKIEEILEEAAAKITPKAYFKANLEMQLRDAHKPRERFAMFKTKNLVSTLGLIGAAVLLLLALNWAFRSLAPKTILGAGKTPLPTQPLKNAPAPQTTPNSKSYDFRGAKLYLAQPLPESPDKANVYLLNKDQPATLDEARALAQRFEIQSEVYTAPGQIPNTIDYMFTDGKQMLSVHSNFYFTYTTDIVKNNNDFGRTSNPNAEATITEFLKSHGFDFPSKIEPDELRNGYIVRPLAPDGIPMQYEFYSFAVMHIALDENGQVLSVEASLMDYEQSPVGTFGVISAEDALQKLLDDSVQAGKIESFHSPTTAAHPEWHRQYSDNQPVTIYGYVSSYPAADPSKPALVLIDGTSVIGNVQGLDELASNTFVGASGQYNVENGIRKFNVDSWRTDGVTEAYIVGNLHRNGDQIILNTSDGNGQYPLIDPPADVPLDTKIPDSQLAVNGVIVDGKMFWTYIRYFDTSSDRGGGGGGGGLGFYQLNLSGMPVPFPTATSIPTLVSGGNYIVQAGDTLSKIAASFGVSVDALSQANNISDPGTIYVGQTLIIPGTSQQTGQKIEGLRGTLSVTIHKKADGSQTTEYELAGKDNKGQYLYVILTGPLPQNLSAYQGLPIIVSGIATTKDQITTVNVEQLDIPFPDLKFQILKGTQKTIDVQGQPVILFTAEDGNSYVQITPNGDMNNPLIGRQGDQVLLETLAIPDERLGGYPLIRVYGASLAISPKNGQPLELSLTASQPRIIDDTQNPINPPPTNFTLPDLTIEKVELVYFVSNPLYQANDINASKRSPYIQPAWHFSGHYSNGDEFDILIQALKQEFLSPEIAPYSQGG